ncbi:MAG: hypothetical protein AB7D41_13515 [Arcobacter sp.]|uniref:hypothetical protein n=1 Tax=Arcobacter sp. TaxID=1872629 RepID=UPI003CFCD7C8
MDFEKFIEKINSDAEYKAVVKKILSNESCALQEAPEYLKDEKELVLFISRFDRLIGKHISTNLKKDKEFLLEFSKYNHTAPYFMDNSLRTNKKFLLDLIKTNYKTLLLLNLDYILGLKDENNN